ncbi:MAG: type II toxin-antitoxin system RelE/ParE family toxin [Candidatus Uhrbacteria bacterium]|nr:type II toxin-antitoxin system RelE/ParE family toxin [Candidatus Uhrbacteria bacterium]
MEIRFFHHEIEEFVVSLEKPTIAKVLRTFDLLEKFGHQLGMPHSKKVGDGIFELRIRGVQEVRFLYTFQRSRIVIVLHGFVKKSQKLPPREFRIAQERKASLT